MIDPSVLKNTLSNPETDGLYSLKALHKASGGLKKDAPSYWLDTQKTTNDIRFLQSQGTNSGSLAIRAVEGRNGDTYVCRKLVYSYAMWISSEFHFMVIDVFDAMLHGKTEEAESIIKVYSGHQPNDPNSLPALLNKSRAQCKHEFDFLVQQNILTREYKPVPWKADYYATPEAGDLVIGRKGHTILFNETIKKFFDVQQTVF